MNPVHLPSLLSQNEIERAASRIAKMSFQDELPVDNVYTSALFKLHHKLVDKVEELTGVEHAPVYCVVSRYLPGGARGRVGFTQKKSTCQIFAPIQQVGPGEMPVIFSTIEGEDRHTIIPVIGDGVFVERGWVWERPPAPASIGKYLAVAFHFIPVEHEGEIV